MVPYDVLIIATAGFFSGIIKTGVGVGAGIFLLPTLSLAFPGKIGLGLGAPLMLTSDIIGLRMYWRQWLPTHDLLKLLGGVVPGVIAGTVLLPLISARVFCLGVGIFGATYALCMLWRNFPVGVLLRRVFGSQHAWSAKYGSLVYGCLGGAATVLAHAGGIVWSLYLVTAAPDRRVFVGTTIIMFFLTNIYKTVSYLLIPIIDVQTMLKVIPAIPMVLLGSYLGNILNKRCNQQLFRKIVLCFIFVLSVLLAFR